MKLISVLLCDFYKTVHSEQYDSSITKLVSYYTPRTSRISNWGSVPVLGIQSFIQEFLIDHFNENFFNLEESEVIRQYDKIIRETLGSNRLNHDKIIALHKLGYLPLDIRALDEGLECPIHCPMIEISNTHPDFAWVTNSIETLMSSELWYQMVTAKVGQEYRKIANKYFEQTCDDPTKARSAISEFGYRGAHSHESAMRASIGFLCSFNKTSTIPAIHRINHYYGDHLCDIAQGMASTEHSVMCSSYAVDGNEETLIKRLLTEIYPDGNFSMVCDSYDYWRIIEEVLPKFKEEILGRNGTLFVRGDSGDPEQILVTTVKSLWVIFGGTVNSKVYKVLDNHIRAIYGDSITLVRAEKIYIKLESLGFSAENVALGAGSFSMLCLEEKPIQMPCHDGGYEIQKLSPFTRDTFGVAIKTTFGQYTTDIFIDDKPYKDMTIDFNIFKNPKTDSGNFKKSQKGCCVVSNSFGIENFKMIDKGIAFKDEFSLKEAHENSTNFLKPVFLNGKLIKTTTFNEIRNRLWNGKF